MSFLQAYIRWLFINNILTNLKKMLENRIELLSQLLGKYDIEHINEKYKEKELMHAIKSLERAKYSEQMSKRIIAEAKRKKISKSKIAYIQSLISSSENFAEDLYIEKLIPK